MTTLDTLKRLTYPWGGLIGEACKLEGFEELLKQRGDLLAYYNRLLELETSNLKLCKKLLKTFSDYDRGYLHSPLLDQLCTSFKTEHPLVYACGKGYLDCVQFLTYKNDKIHAYSESAFRTACKCGHLEVVKFLHGRGVDIHACEDEALLNASFAGHLAIAQFLLDNGADIHAGNEQALCMAVYHNKSAVVRFLLERGADVHYKNESILIGACDYGKKSFEVVKILIEFGANFRIGNNRIFIQACKDCNTEVIKILLDSGVDVNSYNRALFYATRLDEYDTAKLLLERGYIIRPNDEALENFIDDGTEPVNERMRELLIAHGAQIPE